MRLFLALIFAGALAVPLRAQDEPIHMRPEFPLTFPLTTQGENSREVTVSYPILINPTTVIKPGYVLRVMYVLSVNSASATDLALAHQGTMEQSYARNAFADVGGKLPPGLAHEVEGYRRTIWEVPQNFILAMAQFPTESMHLMYTKGGKLKEPIDDRFSFFDGLFVGQPNGKVTVLAVEKGSKSEQAGIKAGDEIEAVGGHPVTDLPSYAAAYAAAKQTAKETDADTYPMALRSAKGERTAAVPLPPKLTNALMNDFFNERPKEEKKVDTSPAPAGTVQPAPPTAQ